MNEPISRTIRARMYFDHLKGEGYSPEMDEDGDVRFKKEGKLYVILVSEKDDEYFNLVYPNFWSIENNEERAKVEKAAIQATSNTKVAKVYPMNDNTWATVELFCVPPEVFKPVFERSIRALQAAVATFVKIMRE